MSNQSQREEIFNSTLHAVAALVSVYGLVLLLDGETRFWHQVSFMLFAGSMMILYTSSALYHAVNGRLKRTIKKIDCLAIYLLIAGTYSPFALVLLNNVRGWVVFGIVWLLALIGIIYELIPRTDERRNIPVTIYLLMGWLALVLAAPLLDKISISGFLQLLTGGLFYTFGLIFYALEDRVRYFHAVWHVFVMAGSLFHFLVVYRYIAGA
ncbi:PAQR family membrane homeostasis protein TrhA [Pelovirga terrestris]|uniref:Hemolysin III family protein n=1 Tax=Pelovirga terrestris TaxID=2771352 RepID=A0A8J6QPP1_9BACT|nr:hemolysin III family protein [Pelovirga terrestris]MBD1401872.1 hemolysin III family protein [Pelovirga terrestris]